MDFQEHSCDVIKLFCRLNVQIHETIKEAPLAAHVREYLQRKRASYAVRLVNRSRYLGITGTQNLGV